MKEPTLPQPTWNGLTQRQHAIKQAQDWQQRTMSDEAPEVYGIVSDLLHALFDEDDWKILDDPDYLKPVRQGR